jgi:polyribonucleotide nucleotidyltransferase
VKVKVIGFDERGKVKLSMRVVDQATGADITEQVGARRPRQEGEGGGGGGREGGGPRRDRRDRDGDRGGERRDRSDAAE